MRSEFLAAWLALGACALAAATLPGASARGGARDVLPVGPRAVAGLAVTGALSNTFPSSLREGEQADMPDRSPIDLALTRDGRYALTANATSDTVSLVDLDQGRLVTEVPVGHRPFCVALAQSGRMAVVSNQNDNSISLLDVTPGALRVTNTIAVGDEPRGVALSPDGLRAYVALSGEDAVACVDLSAGKVEARIPVGVEPWHLALTPDGTRLAVGNARSMDLSVIDTAHAQVLYSVDLRGRNVRHVAVSPDGAWAYVPHIHTRGRPAVQDNIVRGWVISNRLSRCPLKAKGPREAVPLDTPGAACGDVDGAAIRPDGRLIALTAAGTHELLLLKLDPDPPFIAAGEAPDTIFGEMRDVNRFQRVPLGGRPVGLAFTPNGKTIAVANYLLNAVQVVDSDSARVIRTIPLGGSAAPSLARQGEAIFQDADRSFTHWYSCNSCHVEGGTNGDLFDTFNDGSYGTLKKTLSLRGVTQTGPWTWHGWQKDLRQLVHDSLTKTEQGPEPTRADLDALLAYLGTLDFRSNPHRNPDGTLTAPQQRGQAVFAAKGCASCHAPPLYTTPTVYTVGLESRDDIYHGFNPPSLRGVYHRAPYLHRGQADTLRDVLTQYHRSSLLSGQPDPQGQELDDLIAFLNAL
jgi:YVTN family beta-propeller protein